MSTTRYLRRKPPTIFPTSFNRVSLEPTDRKEEDTSKVIIIPVESANLFTGKAHCSLITTKSEEESEDCLICDGGATCTWTKSLESSSLCKPKVVVIQTAHRLTMMNSTYLCYTTYYVCDRVGQTVRSPTDYCQSIRGSRIEA